MGTRNTQNCFRTLSAEGEKEIGHIFKDGYVPVKQITPIFAELAGDPEKSVLVFLVDWTRLSAEQQNLVLTYLSKKFPDAQESEIRDRLETDGYLPIQQKWVIESYDMRMFV